MLSEAKNLFPTGQRPFAPLRVSNLEPVDRGLDLDAAFGQLLYE